MTPASTLTDCRPLTTATCPFTRIVQWTGYTELVQGFRDNDGNEQDAIIRAGRGTYRVAKVKDDWGMCCALTLTRADGHSVTKSAQFTSVGLLLTLIEFHRF